MHDQKEFKIKNIGFSVKLLVFAPFQLIPFEVCAEHLGDLKGGEQDIADPPLYLPHRRIGKGIVILPAFVYGQEEF